MALCDHTYPCRTLYRDPMQTAWQSVQGRPVSHMQVSLKRRCQAYLSTTAMRAPRCSIAVVLSLCSLVLIRCPRLVLTRLVVISLGERSSINFNPALQGYDAYIHAEHMYNMTAVSDAA